MDCRESDQILSRPFWQKLFRELAALDPKRDKTLVDRTRDLLKKELRNLSPTGDQLERIAKRVAGLVAGRVRGQYRTLRQCERLRLEMAQSERRQGHFAAGGTRLIVLRLGQYSRDSMLADFEFLTARRILRLGVALSCPRCGVTSWYGDLDFKRGNRVRRVRSRH